MSSSSNHQKPILNHQTSSQSGFPVPPHYGSTHASGITFLLADHEKFGFSERACYHFDLIETLTQKPQNRADVDTDVRSDDDSMSQSHLQDQFDLTDKNKTTIISDPFPRAQPVSCGVVSLLECVSMEPMKQPKKRKRLLKRIKEFNRTAEETRARYRYAEEAKDYCHQPLKLPLHLSFTTRVAFAYEMTRMVFCIDAKPTMTSTFGNTGYSDGAICAMDRLEKVVRIFFKGLVDPIHIGHAVRHQSQNTHSGHGSSVGADSVDGSGNDPNINRWRPEIAVTVIACYPPTMTKSADEQTVDVLVTDFRISDVESASRLADRIVEFATVEVESEIASRLGRMGGKLHSSASSLRHIIDTCDSAMSTLPSRGRPTIVLATDCRAVECESTLDMVRDRNLKDTPLNVLDLSGTHSHQTGTTHDVREGPNYLRFDADGLSSFPLIIPDDSEALYNACKSTRGYFLDSKQLIEAVNIDAGNVTETSSFHGDVYFAAKRRMIRPNALQWHTLFSLSQCCPLFKSSWGGMPPPAYIEKRRQLIPKQELGDKTFFFSYDLEPVRAKGIIIMRIMDGFRPRIYGTNTMDDDKVSIQFVLNLELRTVLHYEFRYIASPFHSAMVGNAHIRISLSGDPDFIKMVKAEYISQQFDKRKSRVMSLKDEACNKIVRFLEWIKHEDMVETKICPLDWHGDRAYFLRYLGKLESPQLYRHFRLDSFEVMSNSGDTLEHLLQESEDDFEAQQHLVDSLASWSTCTIIPGRLFLRQLPMTDTSLTNYCLVELERTGLARVFKVLCHYFEQVDTNIRMASVRSLQQAITSCNNLFLIPPRHLSSSILNNLTDSQIALRLNNGLQQTESWDLLREPELLPLIAKRRSYFDNFHPLILNSYQTVLFKFVSDSNRLYLVQYHLAMLSNKVVARICMDREKGMFNYKLLPRVTGQMESLFSQLSSNVKSRDQKCARALRSRRNLLYVVEDLNKHAVIAINHTEDVERLILYASKSRSDLRFYNETFTEANSILDRLTTEFMLSGNLDAEVAEIPVGGARQSIGGMQYGRWFLIKYDSENLSIVHFPSEQIKSEGEDHCYRTLTFFTVAFADLYYYKADLPDSEGESENDLLAKFMQDLSFAHKYHFANAAYTALRSSSQEISNSLTKSDFDEVLSCCIEERIVNGMMVANRVSSNNESKLAALLSSILSPVPGGSPYFYFHGDEKNVIKEFYLSDVRLRDDDKSYDMCSIHTSNSDGMSDESSEVHGDTISLIETKQDQLAALAPPFILFKLNDKPASLEEIESICDMVSLSAYVTVFQGTKMETMSEVQMAVSSLLVSQLNSYIAEQTLELFRPGEDGLSENDAKNVKRRLLEAENVATVSTPVHFYLPKTDSMIDATIPFGSEEGLRSHFFLLGLRLCSQERLRMKEVGDGDFIAKSIDENGWCWIHIPETIGSVSIHVFHQGGIRAAELVAKKALQVVEDECHKVNQMLLLENLHTHRLVSKLLIPAGSSGSTSSKKNIDSYHIREKENKTFDLPPGYFKCKVSHEAFYEVNRRCAPSQALLDLENSVFHSFAVSNRQGVFVYKDEEENIFYMRLEACESDANNLHGIRFFAYGIQQAGASITEQLHRLIKKKLMELCVEKISLSLVLEKSHRFRLTQSDIDFVKSFRKNWIALGNDNTTISLQDDEYYEFPVSVYDPVAVLLYFRQNISGSKFFNLLRDPSHATYTDESLISDGMMNVDHTDGIHFKFDRHDFSLCYNATQFQLDSRFQPVSTLTGKGKEYSRKASTGMAMIEFNLLHAQKPLEEAQVHEILIGKILGQEFDVLKLLNSLQFKKLSKTDIASGGVSRIAKFLLKVKIYNTTLHVDAIYRWIELTLNQALISWCTERHLERARTGLCSIPIHVTGHSRDKMLPISKICVGLPSLGGILARCKDLPHPAIKHFEFTGTFPSSQLSTISKLCVEKGLLSPVFNRRVGMKEVDGLTTIRLHGDQPKIVKMRSIDSNVVVTDSETNDMIIDRPIDSPQYISVYGLSGETEKVRRQDIDNRNKSQHVPPPSSFLFEKVSIDDYLSGEIQGSLSNALKVLSASNPYVFMRRIAFILAVSRSSVSILTYNFNPQIFDNAASKLQEILDDFSRLLLDRQKIQQARFSNLKYFGSTSSKLDTSTTSTPKPSQVKKRPVIEKKNTVSSIPEVSENNTQTRTEAKKREIKKPTIVGKSVKGSAAQAMIQQRARARTTRTPSAKVIGSNNASSNQRQQPQRQQKTSTNSQTEKEKKNKNTQEGLIFLPPSLLKDLLSLQSFTSSLSLRRITSFGLYQSLFCNWFVNLSGKELSFRSIDLILGYANAVRSSVFPLVQSAVSNPVPFLLYFAKSAFAHSSHIAVPKLADAINPAIYVMKQIMTSKHFKVHLIHELSIVDTRGELGKVGRCKSWMFIASCTNWAKESSNTGSRSTRYDQRKREKDSCKIKSAIDMALIVLHPPLKMFMFSLNILRRVVIGEAQELKAISPPSLLREVLTVFPPYIQTKHGIGSWYRLLHRNLFWEKGSTGKHSIDTLLKQLASKGTIYDPEIKDCSNGEFCICGHIRCDFKDTHFFLNVKDRQPDGNVSLDLSVLCCTRGSVLEKTVFVGGSPYAKTLSTHILDIAMAIIKRLLKESADDIDRDVLWKKCSTIAKSSPREGKRQKQILFSEIEDLLALCTVKSLSELDPRMSEVFMNEVRDLGLQISDFIRILQNNRHFENYFEIDVTEEGNKSYLFYIDEQKVFLHVETADENLVSCRFIEQRRLLDQNDSAHHRLMESVELFVTTALSWIFESPPCF